MRNTSFFLFGIVLVLVQGHLYRVLHFVPWAGFVPSLQLPMVIFMGVHEYSVARGAALAFLLGYALDILGIAPVGLYTFTNVAIFLLARTAGIRFTAQTLMSQMGLGGLFAVLQSTMVLVLIAIFGRDAYAPRALYPLMIPHGIASALVAPVIFAAARAILPAASMHLRADADMRNLG